MTIKFPFSDLLTDLFDPATSSENSAASQNLLDLFDVTTYNLRLYLASFEGITLDGDNSNIPPPSAGITIAQSGVTDIGIDNLKFITNYGYQAGVYTSTATTFEFELREPLGTTFLDRVRIAANKLGFDNFVKIPFFLEISFKGRDRKSGEPLSYMGPVIRYPIQINDVKIQVDKGGATYSCHAVRTRDYATNNMQGTIQKQTEIVVDNTDLQTLMNKVTERFNNVRYQQDGDHFKEGLSEQYIIVVDDVINQDGKFIDNSPSLELTERKGPYLEFTQDKTKLTLSPGTSITRVIDMIMANTGYLQRGVNNQERVDNETQNTEEPKKLYKIETQIRYLKYDKKMGDYVREITYKIVPFETSTPVANPGEAVEKAPIKFKAPQKLGKSIILRKYSYLFTGQNYHVIDFDFTVNFAWFQALPRQYAHKVNPSKDDAGRLHDNSDDSPHSNRWRQNKKISENDPDFVGPPKALAIDRMYEDDPNFEGPPRPTEEQNEVLFTEAGSYQRRPKNSEGVFPYTCRAAPIEHDAIDVAEGTRYPSRHKAGGLLRSYIQDNIAEFINLELEIRGDPIWLIITETTELFFLFKTGLPEEPADDGLIPPPKETLITGLYQILWVENTFTDGKFTQVLYGRRDYLRRIEEETINDGNLQQ